MRLRPLAVTASLCLLMLLAGCGDGSNSATTSTPPPPTTPNPTPTAPSSTAPDNYMATLTAPVGRNSFPGIFGNVSVDTSANDGRGNVEISPGNGVALNGPVSVTLRFCPEGGICFAVTTFSVGADGKGSGNFTFPQKGTFSGSFDVQTNGATFAQGGINNTLSGTSFNSALLPVNASASGSGRITVMGQTAHVSVAGGPVSRTFEVAVCNSTQSTGACTPLGNVTADAQGNGSGDLQVVNPIMYGVVVLRDSGGLGMRQYQSAFRVQ